jgi:hypothetical protein
MAEELGMAPIGTLDDLLDRAARGVRAGSGLDAVKDQLTEMRDKLYLDLLREPDDRKTVALRDELRAIHKLATALLKREAAGDVAFQLLQQTAGGKEPPPETPLKVERVARRPRRTRGQAAK